MPHMPHLPHLPHLPHMPHMPHLPHMPHMPHLPHMPHRPHLPSSSSVSPSLGCRKRLVLLSQPIHVRVRQGNGRTPHTHTHTHHLLPLDAAATCHAHMPRTHAATHAATHRCYGTALHACPCHTRHPLTRMPPQLGAEWLLYEDEGCATEEGKMVRGPTRNQTEGCIREHQRVGCRWWSKHRGLVAGGRGNSPACGGGSESCKTKMVNQIYTSKIVNCPAYGGG
jgi:hypothetical protein